MNLLEGNDNKALRILSKASWSFEIVATNVFSFFSTKLQQYAY